MGSSGGAAVALWVMALAARAVMPSEAAAATWGVYWQQISSRAAMPTEATAADAWGGLARSRSAAEAVMPNEGTTAAWGGVAGKGSEAGLRCPLRLPHGGIADGILVAMPTEATTWVFCWQRIGSRAVMPAEATAWGRC